MSVRTVVTLTVRIVVDGKLDEEERRAATEAAHRTISNGEVTSLTFEEVPRGDQPTS